MKYINEIQFGLCLFALLVSFPMIVYLDIKERKLGSEKFYKRYHFNKYFMVVLMFFGTLAMLWLIVKMVS